jgi:hypothetical protein
MLSLLIGTRKRDNDSCIYKASKEWYYDRNVWKVVLEFGIHKCVSLPYTVKKQHKLVYSCLNVLHINDRPAYIERRDHMLYYMDGTPVGGPEYLKIENATWIHGNGSSGSSGGDGNKLLVNTYKGDVYIYRFNGNKVNKRRIRECKNASHVTLKGDTLVWLSPLALHISNARSSRKCITHYVDHFPNCRRRIAIDTGGLIYVAIPSDRVAIYKGDKHLYDIILLVESPISYILIHCDILHVLTSGGTLIAFTLKGELISSHFFKVPCTSMCTTSKGELLLSDGLNYYVM